MADPTDVNVDDLRRRARRRLVGAVVLALAAAVFVPMLLEGDPKPLGEDVSVKIPPVDDGKFVNRLNDRSKPEAPKTMGKGEPAKTEPAKSEVLRPDPAKAGAAVEPVSKEVPAATANAAPKRSLADAEQKVLGSTPAKPPAVTVAKAPAPQPAVALRAAPAPASSANDDSSASGFSVQLAAFADDKGANALSNKLKKAGYPAYTEPLTTSRGTLWRVRVGPYPSRDTATTSRDKLKDEGYAGIVAPAK